MADAQLEPPCQLDAESVRALALGINGNPFAALGPHDTRVGRITARSCQAPPRSSCCGGPMARADGRERPVRKTLSKKRTPSRTASGFSPASARTSARKDSMRWSIGPAPAERLLPS